MITVYMLVYNEENHLASAIESVLKQTFTNFQLVISNNFSTDSSEKIIDKYAKTDSRIIKISPKSHCNSIEHCNFIFEKILPNYNNKYTIHIGGHDLWDQNYLEILFKRAESDPQISIVYGDTYDLLYERNEVLGLYDNYVTCSGIAKPLIPHTILLSLTINIPFMGLMSEQKRKNISLRHQCVGADHFLTTEMALQGKIVHQPGASMFLRRTKHHGSLSEYAKRHLKSSATDSSQPHRDFFLQLEWALYLVELAVSDPDYSFYQQTPIKNMLKISLFNAYIIRYAPNLNVINADGMKTFLQSHEMASLYDANNAAVNFVEELISANTHQ